MRLALLAAIGLAIAAPSAIADEPNPQSETIAQGLDFYCADWMTAALDEPAPRHEGGVRAGWREFRSAAPAVGPILMKGGDWGQVSVVRVAQADGHRCSMAIQLSSIGWTTETAYAAVVAWTMEKWPEALMHKERGEGPRGTRETIWRMEGGTILTLQESPAPGAQPNVFITLQKLREI